jgi:peptide/nickel transport system substrate-binding protein
MVGASAEMREEKMRQLVVRLRRPSAVGSAAVAAALVVVATVGGSAAAASARTAAQRGGVYRVGWETSFNFSDDFDPTGEYLVYGAAILTSLVDRTLVSYRHVAGAAGDKLVPDIATAVPRPTDGGTTYTFHLKPGVMFGPPVNRAVTSKDVLYAFERLANPKDGGQYAFYYTVIKGFSEYGAGKAKTISGIETPNDSTVVFHLAQPAGDFLYRLGMAATGPIPAEVAKCFEGEPGRYGRDVVSTGPYMLAGIDKVDISSCSTLKPASGFDGQTTMTLVRNPNYAPNTDSPAVRQSLPDEFQFTVDSSATDIFDKIDAGSLDDEIADIPPQVLKRYIEDSSLHSRLHLPSNDGTLYLPMNLSTPPFDDIHVRKAMNWIMDKAGIIQSIGGPSTGRAAHHVVPDTLFDNQLGDFNPYATPGDHGSLAKAKAAMRGSKYDLEQDGTCSAPQCKGVLLLSDTRRVDPAITAVIEASAKKIGITFTVRAVSGAFPLIQTPSRNIPIADFTGWAKDYPDPLTFFEPLFNSASIIPNGNPNSALVGITPAIAKKVGVKADVSGIPSVDSMLHRCAPLSGQPRLTCYERLDAYLMTKVLPWVPVQWSNDHHITSARVTQWAFDQSTGSTGYAHVAVQ